MDRDTDNIQYLNEIICEHNYICKNCILLVKHKVSGYTCSFHENTKVYPILQLLLNNEKT